MPYWSMTEHGARHLSTSNINGRRTSFGSTTTLHLLEMASYDSCGMSLPLRYIPWCMEFYWTSTLIVPTRPKSVCSSHPLSLQRKSSYSRFDPFLSFKLALPANGRASRVESFKYQSFRFAVDPSFSSPFQFEINLDAPSDTIHIAL